MSLRRNFRKAFVNGIANAGVVERFKIFLENEFKAADVADKGQYVLLHKKIKLTDQNSIGIIVYASEIVVVSGSNTINDEDFGKIATKIIQLAQQAITFLEETRPISIMRAKCILEFAEKLDLGDEYQRMVAIILSDTCNEIVLREQMKSLKIEGPPLEEGVPDKISRIKNRGYAVPFENEIKNLREERNRIVHHGDAPHREVAKQALDIARKLIDSVRIK